VIDSIDLRGKHVLLIAPQYFGYEKEIRAELERCGASVDWIPDRPFSSAFLKALTTAVPGLIQPLIDKRYLAFLKQSRSYRYDLILVINGQTISAAMMRRLRAVWPEAKTILYMWDSMKNRKRVALNLPFFDSAFTFDPQSARDYGLTLRPLFFSPGFAQSPQDTFEYTISFIGTAHSDRYSVVRRLREKLPVTLSCYWFLYLQAPWVLWIYRALKPDVWRAGRSEFQFLPLDKGEVQRVFARSRIVLDIEHPRQQG
jgi:hypothetical protein